MIRLYTGNLLDGRLENDFERECPFRHKTLYAQTLRKRSVREAVAEILDVSADALDESNVRCSFFHGIDYGIVAEILEVPNRNTDGSRAALRYKHPFAVHPPSVRSRFFTFAIRKSVERDLDVSFVTNSTEGLKCAIHGLQSGLIPIGGVTVKVYCGKSDEPSLFGSKELLDIYQLSALNLFG